MEGTCVPWLNTVWWNNYKWIYLSMSLDEESWLLFMCCQLHGFGQKNPLYCCLDVIKTMYGCTFSILLLMHCICTLVFVALAQYLFPDTVSSHVLNKVGQLQFLYMFVYSLTLLLFYLSPYVNATGCKILKK